MPPPSSRKDDTGSGGGRDRAGRYGELSPRRNSRSDKDSSLGYRGRKTSVGRSVSRMRRSSRDHRRDKYSASYRSRSPLRNGAKGETLSRRQYHHERLAYGASNRHEDSRERRFNEKDYTRYSERDHARHDDKTSRAQVNSRENRPYQQYRKDYSLYGGRKDGGRDERRNDGRRGDERMLPRRRLEGAPSPPGRRFSDGRSRSFERQRYSQRENRSLGRSSSSSSNSDSNEDDDETELTEDQLMAKLMGVTEFSTTKGKDHSISDLSGANKKTRRRYRQYMNRRGGFNRPLSPVF